jgi:hypothetical protein
MKDEFLDEGIATNLTSYFSDLYFIYYGFYKCMNEHVY